ncbi:hypothetical protein, variant [Sphaeroforma arctica JP610]|uniref:E3 ubiquitin-protein ligase listerin n=1 Tax=Sphaeroforma arctica JP610 TaxID=667725 RepID=A0A0L0FLW9_9EUKA|nr:hypothetical protein, variant [Sphaeroforma arctica JP610]KNC77774.1 hypothetical protein, variant [Sphaeroforma arctica JP610]|eukprot:XP_014151676.1 hypothetical protein, variant [Sphaeroforma arctica JP610]
MGRSKNDDRQKKGTTSSSSQAAAELVSRQSPNAFVGFQSLQNNPVFLAAGGQGGHVDGSGSDLLTDSKFKIVFKSLLKRDAVTKVKALQSLGELIKTADEAAVVQSLPLLDQIVASKKFWSLLQSDSVEIRGRFYTLLLCAVSADQTGIEANMSLAAPAVLSMCGEKQSGLQTAMWNTYLTVLQQMPCIWVTVKKGAITHLKLWKMLSSAGHGSPALALPCCVPLLSVLPSHVRRDVLFVDKWLSCTWEGVTVCATDTQRNVVVNGYVEALAYLSKDARECEDSHALLSKMWLGHTLATVAEAMTTNQMALDCRTLFNGVAGILSTGCVPSDIQTEFTTQLKQAAVAKSEADVANSEHGASIARAACEHLSPALIAFVQFGGEYI